MFLLFFSVDYETPYKEKDYIMTNAKSPHCGTSVL